MSTTIKNFFDRQKRDLSDKSNEDDERKKVGDIYIYIYILYREREERERRERNLSTSLSKDGTDIFEEGIESPTLCWHFI